MGPAGLTKSLCRADESKSKTYAPGGTKPAGKEAIMLDFAFVALGFAVIAVMGLYAMGLRQL